MARPEHFPLLIFPVSESRVVFDVMAKGGVGGERKENLALDDDRTPKMTKTQQTQAELVLLWYSLCIFNLKR